MFVLAVNGPIVTSPEPVRPNLIRSTHDSINDVKKITHVRSFDQLFSSK